MLQTIIAWPPLIGTALALLAVTFLWRRGKDQRSAAEWERARAQELEAYCGLQVSFTAEAGLRATAEQSKLVCRLVVDKSVFYKAALLLRDPAGRLFCVGSAGMDELTLTALNACGERLMRDENADSRDSTPRDGTACRKSFSAVLGTREEFDLVPGHGCHEAILVPIRLHRGRLVGALAVCIDGETQRMADTVRWMPPAEWMPRATAPLELLAAKLARIAERDLLIDRLMQVERLAGAGHLVARVAQSLTVPLVTVLGSAELIAETAADPRVRQDAQTIVARAMDMQETLGCLRDFWKLPASSESDIGIRSVASKQVADTVHDVA